MKNKDIAAIIALRDMGFSQADISEKTGIPESTVRYWIIKLKDKK